MSKNTVYPLTGCVRTAVTADLPFIREWLKSEERNGVGFIHNWGMIESACAKKMMKVFVTAEGPLGFLTCGISYDTILQTKSDCKRHGIGRALVEHAIRDEEALNNAVLVIQCEPRSSVEFWSKMGFEAHRNAEDFMHETSIYMQRLSKAANPRPLGDDVEMVTVRVYPESALYSEEQVKPDRVHYVMARLDEAKRTLELARRVSVAHESMLKDPVVEISWGGLDIIKGKAKHEQAAAAGFKRTPNECGWYLDLVTFPEKFS
jgi:GNAT superfamily N-acetyltransferase